MHLSSLHSVIGYYWIRIYAGAACQDLWTRVWRCKFWRVTNRDIPHCDILLAEDRGIAHSFVFEARGTRDDSCRDSACVGRILGR